MSDRELVTNAVDEEQIARARRKVRDRERRTLALWRQQMSTADGRELVWSLLGECQIFEYIGGADVNAVYMQLGLRNFGAQLLARLMANHSREFLLMQNEAMARDQRERQENVAARTAPAAARGE